MKKNVMEALVTLHSRSGMTGLFRRAGSVFAGIFMSGEPTPTARNLGSFSTLSAIPALATSGESVRLRDRKK
jgi:hypothetical protein